MHSDTSTNILDLQAECWIDKSNMDAAIYTNQRQFHF